MAVTRTHADSGRHSASLVERPEGFPRAPGHVRRVRLERAAVLLSALLAVAVSLVAVADVAVPGRALLAVGFVLTVPGVPLVVRLRLADPLLASSLAVAVSLSCALLTATASVTLDAWNPPAWAFALAALHVAVTPWALRSRAPYAGPAGLPAADRGSPTRSRFLVRGLSLAVLLCAVGLWWLAAAWADLDAAGATGLAAVLGWPYVVALLLVAGVAAAALLRRSPDGLVLAAAAVVLALLMFGFVNVAEGTAGLPTAWRHVGFAQFITDNGTSFYGLDARASWPAFFAGSAALVHLAGLPDASPLLMLSPVFFNVAAIAPLLVIARSITASRRIAWLSVFLYLAFNWYQQDYFAPQATAFLLYLTVVAALAWLATPVWGTTITGDGSGERPRGLRRILAAVRRQPPPLWGFTADRVLALECVLVLIAAAVVVTHQLTPISLVLTLLVFAVTGSTVYRRLWLITSLLFIGWFSYGATDYWEGHVTTIFGDVGRVGTNLDQAVSSRIVGDPTYQAMQQVRLVWSAVYLLLAVIGWYLIRHRPVALPVALLTASTGGLVLLQSYGGEVVFRVFVFAAPLLAPLAAIALHRVFLRGPPGTPRRRAVAVAALAAVLAGSALVGTVARGVNISFERVTADDLSAARVLWDRVEEGDEVGMLYAAGAYAGGRYGDWSTVWLREDACGLPPLVCTLVEKPRFILLGRTQDSALELVSGAAADSSEQLAADLRRLGRYRLVYSGEDAQLLEIRVPR